MKLWIIFVLLFGIFKGIREPIKKEALKRTDVLSVLFMYTFIGFLISAPTAGNVFDIEAAAVLMAGLKAALLFVAWMASLMSISRLPVSLYGIVDLSRMIFSTTMGVLLFGEALTLKGIVSLALICVGLYMSSNKKSIESEGCAVKDVLLALTSSLFSASSGVLDKYVMTNYTITSGQLQFWFMFILSVMYLAYILLRGKKLDVKGSLKNPWIYAMSILLVLGDRLLFTANADPDSKVTVMTLIKQCSVLVTIGAGKILYGEKNILRKVISAVIIVCGILLAAV